MQMAAAAARATSPKLVDIARSAIDDLQPVVVVNRRIDTAIDQVDGARSDPFTTIHDDPRLDARTLARRAVRSLNERVRGTHGDGDNAGHTVYGSVRFVPQQAVRDGAAAVVSALREQGDAGVRAYGPVTFVADPGAVGSRTTYAADDTGVTLARVRDETQLAQVVAERIERAAGGRAPTVDQLLQLPGTAARDAVRGWLLSDDLAGSNGYIEAQVRRLAPADVLAAVVDLRPMSDVAQRSLIDPGWVPRASEVAKLAGELDRHGIPLTRIEPTG